MYLNYVGYWVFCIRGYDALRELWSFRGPPNMLTFPDIATRQRHFGVTRTIHVVIRCFFFLIWFCILKRSRRRKSANSWIEVDEFELNWLCMHQLLLCGTKLWLLNLSVFRHIFIVRKLQFNIIIQTTA